jgi:hypothetical protein
MGDAKMSVCGVVQGVLWCIVWGTAMAFVVQVAVAWGRSKERDGCLLLFAFRAALGAARSF